MNSENDIIKKEGRGRPRIIPLTEIESWKEEHGERFNDPRAIKFVQSLLQRRLIENSEIVAAHLLHDSTISRINACKYNTGVYYKISCDWDSSQLMTLDIILKKEDMWKAWVQQSYYYEESGEQADRPSIDRIDELKDYTLDNIQMLSIKNNVCKAIVKVLYALKIGDKYNNQSVEKFDSTAAMRDRFGRIQVDTGEIVENEGQEFLIQSEDALHGKKSLDMEDKDIEFGDAVIFMEVSNGIVPVRFMDRLPDGSEIPFQVSISNQIKLNEIMALPKSKRVKPKEIDVG
ncbi:hypothetical protein ACP8HI_12500 [Paenibacillus sp. FA6]|uniref:hypothetical protein n=1 Tax=Paenibacillus sp. FA6 TaxID=3413029 RepID=UPI003F65C106